MKNGLKNIIVSPKDYVEEMKENMNNHPYAGTKCEHCKHLGYHPGGSWFAVAEGGDDPYTYFYCLPEGWSDSDVPESGEPDFWENCKSFEKQEDEVHDDNGVKFRRF